MFHNRLLNNKSNRLHEQILRMIFNDKDWNFEELLVKNDSVLIHRNSC